MLALFLAFFCASVIFIAFFLFKLPEDLKKQSLRPIFILLLAIGFWIGTMPAFLAPEIPSYTAYPPINVIVGNSVANTVTQYPSENITSATSALPVRDYNAYFYIWITIWLFYIFLGILWYVLLVRAKAMEAMDKGSDALSKLEKRLGK